MTARSPSATMESPATESIRSNDFRIRMATPADLQIVLHHRRSMFNDMGYRDQARMEAMFEASEPFFAERINDGRYKAWLVEEQGGKVVAGGGIVLFEYHASPSDPSPIRPLIV